MKYKIVSLNVIMAVAILTTCFSACASCAFQPGWGLVSYNQTLPMTELSIPRNAPVGLYGDVVSFQRGSSTLIACTGSVTTMLKFSTPQTPETSIANVYKTGVTGLGFQVWDDYSGTIFVGNNSSTWFSHPGSSMGVYLTNVKMQFYITGPVSPGTATFSGPFVEAWVTSYGGIRYTVMNLTGSVNVKFASCETPNIKVNLEKHHTSEFSGINSTSTAKSFNFEIKNCDPGMNSVNYTFKPATNITLKNSGALNQYLTLSSDSSATGVGVQVLYDNGTVVPFNSKIKYTGYNQISGGSYVIPMKARYIKTASTMTGGTANSALEFTMSYE